MARADDNGISDGSWEDYPLGLEFGSYMWTTRDGDKIPLWELNGTHIANILRKFPEADNVQAWAKFKRKVIDKL
jgi:hypothetical protein